MSAFEFLQITKESAYKTPMASPVRGTDQIVIRLSGGNAFTPRVNPIQKQIDYGGGLAIPALSLSDRQEVKGELTTEFYASQAAFLLNWALTRINAGQTLPWATTEPPGDLASVTIDHGIMRSDGSIKRRRYLGCKATSFGLDVGEDNEVAKLKFGIVGSTPQGNTFDSSTDPDATTFPVPTDAEYPTDPYLFIHTAGNFTLGSVRTQYASLGLDVQNAVDGRWFESRFISVARFRGRKSTLKGAFYYKPTPDDRTALETLAAQSATVEFSNGTHTATVAYNAQNKFTDIGDDLQPGKVYMQNVTLLNLYDAAAGADIAVTTT